MSKKIKVLVIGDNHCKDKKPANRVDEYWLTSTNEFLETLQIAEDQKVDYAIYLGDIFDSRIAGPKTRNTLIKHLLCQPNGKEWSFRKFVVVGNHDIESSYPLMESDLGTLIEAGLLEKTDFSEEFGVGFAHFNPDIEEQIENGLFLSKEAVIWACHAGISVKPNNMYRTVLFDNIPMNETTQVVFAGHIHTPMSCERQDGKMFVNPGAVGRTSAKKDNIERDIYVVLLEYDLDGNTYDLKYIPITNALPAELVFRLEEIKEEKEVKKELQEFVKQTASFKTGAWTYTTLDDKVQSIREFGKEKNVDDDVVEIAVNAMVKHNSNKKKVEA